MKWQILPISQVLTDVKSGFACGEDSFDGMFQFRMNNIDREGTLNLSKIRRVPRSIRNINTFLVESGDVLFNATNSPELVGKTLFFSGHDEPVVFSNHFLRLRPNFNILDGRFLARWLQFQFQRRVFQGMCHQWVNQATVGRDALLALLIPIPPLEEQKRIAEILDRADS
jgi:type I restriction enzyme, S subunit